MKTKKEKYIYKKESYQLIGQLFDVYKELGYGYREKFYQQALAEILTENKIPFKEQLYVPLIFKGKRAGRYFIDFYIYNKIALEIKVADRFYKSHQNQLLSYLTSNNIKLGILAIFAPGGVKIKRLINERANTK